MKTYHHNCRKCPYILTSYEDLYDTGEEHYCEWCAFAASPNYGRLVLKSEVAGCDLDFDANYFFQKYKNGGTD